MQQSGVTSQRGKSSFSDDAERLHGKDKPNNFHRRFNRSILIHWHRHENARNLVAFFCFGLANNFGYVVMLSAAFDLLSIFDEYTAITLVADEKKLFKRECNVLSTGAILLADIVPCLVIKMLAPFLPLRIHIRMTAAVLTSALGLILTALALNRTTIIAGVAFVSFSSGLGETSLVAYSVYFKSKYVISFWASGTGAAGLLGSFAYSTLLQIGLKPYTAILIMLFMPCLMAICFWAILRKPLPKESFSQPQEEAKPPSAVRPSLDVSITLKSKTKLIPRIMLTYTLWFGLVYLFEYFINHGLYELTYIPNTFLSHQDQYRWYFSIYQLGVFISRSTGTLVPIRRTWIQALLQGILLLAFLFEAIYGYMTYMVVPMILCLWEGLNGGSSYVNTYQRISTEMPPNEREFAMSLNSIGDSLMITLAGAISQPVHDAICKTPPTYS